MQSNYCQATRKEIMTVAVTNYSTTWEKLPDDYQLDEEPADNLNQPLLAAALSEAL